MKLTGVIGVIIITFIVIIVAAFTFAHVESIREQQQQRKDKSLEGIVENITLSNSIFFKGEEIPYYQVIIKTPSANETMSYHMIFEDTYPPLKDILLRFYYNEISQNQNTFLWITDIEQLDN